ncbi:MAG TPA: hypothetical protein V6C81_23085 [Planktothrix sp.]|jgi:hypothetical protein
MKTVWMAAAFSFVLTFNVNAGRAQSKSEMQLAEQYYAANDMVQAERHLRLQLHANPKDANAHYLIGNIYARQNRVEAANYEYAMAMTLDPTGPAHKYSLQAMRQLSARSLPLSQDAPAHTDQVSTESSAGSDVKNSTLKMSRQTDEQEQSLNAERDAKIAEVMKDAERRKQTLESEMQEAIDANGQKTSKVWLTNRSGVIMQHETTVYDPGPANEQVRNEYRPKLDQIEADAHKRVNEIKAAYAQRAAALENSAIGADRSYAGSTQSGNLTLVPKGSDLHTRNYQNTGETTGAPLAIKAKPAGSLQEKSKGNQ